MCGINKLNNTRTRGRLVLVDLAGSERLDKSGAVGSRMKEAQNINKYGFQRLDNGCLLRRIGALMCVAVSYPAALVFRSLSALGNVIASLANKTAHVPFRDSKLTYLLQDSLGKDNKTLMIVQVNPMMGSRGETMCSLNFATRVRTVELGKAKAHATVDMEEIGRLKAAVRLSCDFVVVLHCRCRCLRCRSVCCVQHAIAWRTHGRGIAWVGASCRCREARRRRRAFRGRSRN